MPAYAAKYLVTYVDELPYEAHPTTTINIAGHAITSIGWSTSFQGINRFELQGLVDASTFTIIERLAGNSWDPVGTTFYSYQNYTINDPSLIPEKYYSSPFGTTGTNGMFSFSDQNRDEVSFGPVKYDFATDFAGSYSLGSLTVSTKDTFFTLAENAASAAGFSGLSTAIKNVVAAKSALESVATDGMKLVSSGIEGFGNPYTSHKSFDAQAEQFMLGAGDTFEQALIDQTLYPGNPTLEGYADNILEGIRIVGTAGQTGALPVTVAAELVLRLEAGPLTLETSFSGTAKADVIIQPGGTNIAIDGGGGNDFIVTGSGNNRITGGAGNDYIYAGRGDDVLVAGQGSSAFFDGGSAAPGDYFNGGPGTDTAVFSGAISSYRSISSGSANGYVWGTEGGTYLKSIEVIQFSDGKLNTVSGSPLIDNLYYASQNVDVFHAEIAPAAHYSDHGWREGRNPNAIFQTNSYLSVHSDVKSANINPLEHYNNSGWKEGRDVSILFDTSLYLIRNPDVFAANINPLEHYLSYGQSEGRATYATIGNSVSGGFDREYYLIANPDVGSSGMDPEKHFQEHGWKEGRDPNAYFDTSEYLARYIDVSAAKINPLDHYNNSGWKELRDPSSKFDTSSYLDIYRDVSSANINPLQHYLVNGALEGRYSFDDGVLGDYFVSTSYELFI